MSKLAYCWSQIMLLYFFINRPIWRWYIFYFLILFYKINLFSRSHKTRKNIQWNRFLVYWIFHVSIYNIWLFIFDHFLKNFFPNISIIHIMVLYFILVYWCLFFWKITNFFGLIINQSFLFAQLKNIWFILIYLFTKFFDFIHFLRFPICKLSMNIRMIIIFFNDITIWVHLFKRLNFLRNKLSVFIGKLNVLCDPYKLIPNDDWIYLSITNPALLIIYFMLSFDLPLSRTRNIIFVSNFSC